MRGMKIRLLPAVLGLCVAGSPAIAEENFYYVDPVAGIDDPAGGHSLAPWKTVSFGLTQPLNPLPRFVLAPGEYSEASGENFPLVIPEFVGLVGEIPGCARFVPPPSRPDRAPAAVFLCRTLEGSSTTHRFWNFEVAADHPAFEFVVEPNAVAHFDLRNLTIRAQRGIRLATADGSTTYLSISGSKVMAPDGCLNMDLASTGSQTSLNLFMVYSHLSTGTMYPALAMHSSGKGAWLVADVSRTIVRDSGIGVLLEGRNDGHLEADFQHGLFWSNGWTHQSGGALVEDAGAGRSRPLVRVENTIFWANRFLKELPHYDPRTYTLAYNMFQDPHLARLPTSVPGKPVFVDPQQNDFHTLAASATRDAGAPVARSGQDVEGGPLGVTQGGDGMPDVGPDEFFERNVYFHRKVRTGQSARLRVLGPGGELAFVLVGPHSFFPGFGSGLQLKSLYFPHPLAEGVLPPNGLLRFSIPVANDPALVGFPFKTQAVYWNPRSEELEFSLNAPNDWICGWLEAPSARPSR